MKYLDRRTFCVRSHHQDDASADIDSRISARVIYFLLVRKGCNQHEYGVLCMRWHVNRELDHRWLHLPDGTLNPSNSVMNWQVDSPLPRGSDLQAGQPRLGHAPGAIFPVELEGQNLYTRAHGGRRPGGNGSVASAAGRMPLATNRFDISDSWMIFRIVSNHDWSNTVTDGFGGCDKVYVVQTNTKSLNDAC